MRAKIKHLRIELEDGNVIEHSSGMFNQSRNYRTAGKGSARITAEWFEHVVTWHTATEEELEPESVPVPVGLNGDELMKQNPLFAGIQDGKAHYHKLPPNWEELFKEFIVPESNGENGR